MKGVLGYIVWVLLDYIVLFLLHGRKEKLFTKNIVVKCYTLGNIALIFTTVIFFKFSALFMLPSYHFGSLINNDMFNVFVILIFFISLSTTNTNLLCSSSTPPVNIKYIFASYLIIFVFFTSYFIYDNYKKVENELTSHTPVDTAKYLMCVKENISYLKSHKDRRMVLEYIAKSKMVPWFYFPRKYYESITSEQKKQIATDYLSGFDEDMLNFAIDIYGTKMSNCTTPPHLFTSLLLEINNIGSSKPKKAITEREKVIGFPCAKEEYQLYLVSMSDYANPVNMIVCESDNETAYINEIIGVDPIEGKFVMDLNEYNKMRLDKVSRKEATFSVFHSVDGSGVIIRRINFLNSMARSYIQKNNNLYKEYYTDKVKPIW